MTTPFSFHARVADDAISRVTRLFNASLDDIFAELFQNARRAGATQIAVSQINYPEMGNVICVVDNGSGIVNPEHLFTLGQSAWDSDLQSSEDAAGMGFFALAGRRVRIIAQEAGTTRSWMIDAEPDSFAGKVPITCRPGPANNDGMTILIETKPNEPIVSVANHAAKYLPVEVMVDGVVAERRDFLGKADHIEEWRGIRIGLFETSSTAYRNDGNVNFHGVTLQAALPHVLQSFHRAYYARIEVRDCAELKLVLPARKEVVANAFYDELKHQILRIMFERIANSDAHSLSHGSWLQVRAMGIELPEATPMLRPFSPSHADHNYNDGNPPKPLQPDDLLLDSDDSPIDEQNLAMALSGTEDAPQLVEPNGSFTGYSWYDALPCLALSGYRLEHAGSVERLPLGETPLTYERPKSVFMEGQIGTMTDLIPWQLQTDVLILGEEYSHIDEANFCVAVGSEIGHDDLLDLVKRALFYPSDDVEAGSYNEQERWFLDEAEDRIVALLHSRHEMNVNAVIRTVSRELYWLCKPAYDITIRIVDGQITVEGIKSGDTPVTLAGTAA